MALQKNIQFMNSSIKNVFRRTYILFSFCLAQLQQSENVEGLKIWGGTEAQGASTTLQSLTGKLQGRINTQRDPCSHYRE